MTLNMNVLNKWPNQAGGKTQAAYIDRGYLNPSPCLSMNNLQFYGHLTAVKWCRMQSFKGLVFVLLSAQNRHRSGSKAVLFCNRSGVKKRVIPFMNQSDLIDNDLTSLWFKFVGRWIHWNVNKNQKFVHAFNSILSKWCNTESWICNLGLITWIVNYPLTLSIQ